MQINELAIEADLPRTDVLAWLRQLEKAPEECVPTICSSRGFCTPVLHEKVVK